MSARYLIDAAQACRLAAEGHAVKTIAAMMGCHRDSVLRALHIAGQPIPVPLTTLLAIKTSHFWQRNDAALIQMRNAGLSARQAAAALGVTKNAVIGRLGRIRVPAIQARHPIEWPTAGCCVWPHGNPGQDGFHFCGHAVAEYGRPYCPQHTRKATAGRVKLVEMAP